MSPQPEADYSEGSAVRKREANTMEQKLDNVKRQENGQTATNIGCVFPIETFSLVMALLLHDHK